MRCFLAIFAALSAIVAAAQPAAVSVLADTAKAYDEETLRSLHSKTGRHVGIISHVEELQERIPVQIQVIQEGNTSSSKIRIVPEYPL